jgi:hypothetical protein
MTKTTFSENLAAIRRALALAAVPEDIPDLPDEMYERIAAWLASEGIGQT